MKGALAEILSLGETEQSLWHHILNYPPHKTQTERIAVTDEAPAEISQHSLKWKKKKKFYHSINSIFMLISLPLLTICAIGIIIDIDV